MLSLMRLRPIIIVFNDISFLTRIGGHVGLLVIVSIVVASRVSWAPFESQENTPQAATSVSGDIGYGGPELPIDYTQQSANPITLTPKRSRREIVKYRVQPNDTVSGIAERFEISPETILWSNSQLENDPDMLSLGEELAILPINGPYHLVTAGDTIEGIAKKYKVDARTIIDYELNDFKPSDLLVPGQKLIIPGGRKLIAQRNVRAYSGPIPASAALGTGSFGWPVSGVITQKYWSGHAGIDIGAPTGTPVFASDSGFVVSVGWDNSGFGKTILIDHRNGYLTLYGHLGTFAVAVGDSVMKGRLIGRVGNTGRSTGPHLDFRIRQNGVWRNPFGFLR